MTVSSIEPFVIDHDSIADAYLEDLLKNPENRSMHVVERHANKLINDPRIRGYFIAKGNEMIASTL